jgi:hypothetical protein
MGGSVAAPRPRAYRLSDEGPFLSHPSRGARPGDVLISSAFARFYITGTPDADGYVPFAGWVIDADMMRAKGDPDYDGLDGYYPLVNVSPIAADSVTIVHDGSDGLDAQVRVQGQCVAIPVVLGVQGAVPHPVPVDVTLTYSLGPHDRALRIQTRVENHSDSPQPVNIGDVVLFDNDEAEPFSVPGGFDVGSDATHIAALGSSHEWRPISLAVYAEQEKLGLFEGSAVRDQIGAGDESLWGVTLAQDTLEPGQALEATRYLGVGRDIGTALSTRPRSADVQTGHIMGRAVVGDRPLSGARISLFADPELQAFTGQVITDGAGAFDVEVPQGQYYVVASGRGNGEYVEVPGRRRELAEGYLPSEIAAVALEADSSVVLELRLGAAARADIIVRDIHGALTPAKLTFQAEDARPAVLLAAGERVPYAALGVRQIVWVPAGVAELNLEPGAYTVIASRGFDANLDVRQHVQFSGDQTTTLEMTVGEVVDHAGYVAIDSHVHGFYSQHGEVTVEERVITAAAEGLRVHVATDHDWVADYAPALTRTGLDGRLLSVSGVELTTTNGHHCLWPLRRDATKPRGGAALWWLGGSLNEWYEYYRARGAIVTQVAHGSDYFRRAGYDTTTGLVNDDAVFSWDFNAMEVHNGKGGGGRDALVPIWLSLIHGGHRVAPVAASDSHARVPEVGSARTYVRVSDDSSFDAMDVARAVSEQKTVASTGPFIDLRAANGGRPGDTVALDANGEVTLDITVWSAAWIPVTEVELLSDGERIAHWDGSTRPVVGSDPARAVWFEHRLTLKPERDTWYVVQVRGDRDLAPVYPDVRPWALTAPIFVDADADGQIRLAASM